MSGEWTVPAAIKWVSRNGGFPRTDKKVSFHKQSARKILTGEYTVLFQPQIKDDQDGSYTDNGLF